jgi:hypothetical protein
MGTEQNELNIDQLRGLISGLDPGLILSLIAERGFVVTKDIKPSEQCGGDVTRTATETGQTREAAEDAALKAAREAAQRACKDKKCEHENCKYVEKSSSGSSASVVPATTPSSFTATMTTAGSCGCE